MDANTLVDYLTEEQRRITGELASLVDPCLFGKVKDYLRNPRSEITQVVVVQPGYRLEEVGAVMVNGGLPQFSIMLAMGAMRLGVERAAPGDRHTIALESISNATRCKVLYLPPAYVVQVDTSA